MTPPPPTLKNDSAKIKKNVTNILLCTKLKVSAFYCCTIVEAKKKKKKSYCSVVISVSDGCVAFR